MLKQLDIQPADIDFVISCSEEAVGDSYNRGGGNLAKAIAEDVGCVNASGCDTKAFCAGPMYAMVHGASLIQSGVAKKVAVVAGGSLAKLGMKFESHLKKNMPVLEDVLGSFAAILSPAKPGQVCMRLDSAAFHPVGAGASPQAMAECLAEKPLAKLGMKLTDVDRYGVELHNPEITVPSGQRRCAADKLSNPGGTGGDARTNSEEPDGGFCPLPRYARLCADAGPYSLGDRLLGTRDGRLATSARFATLC